MSTYFFDDFSFMPLLIFFRDAAWQQRAFWPDAALLPPIFSMLLRCLPLLHVLLLFC